MAINWIEEQIGKVKDKRELSKSEILKLWYDLGFTRGIKHKTLEWKTAKSMQNTVDFLLSGNVEHSDEFDTVVFPIIRRVLRDKTYDGHEIAGAEIWNFMRQHKVDEIFTMLDAIREGDYKPHTEDDYLSNPFVRIVFELVIELYGVRDDTLYDALKFGNKIVTEKEKHLLKDIINIDFEAELCALTAIYFVYCYQKNKK